MMTFKHAGDLGDIILSLPVLRALCHGAPSDLVIEPVAYTRQKLTPDKWCGLDELLLRQPYISAVRPFTYGEPISFNLNDFRARLFQSLRAGIGKDKHLSHWMCEAHAVPYACMDTPWLTIEDPIKAARVVFVRAGAGRPQHQVYQNPTFPWHLVWKKYGKEAVFVGTEAEYDIFRVTCGDVPHYKTKGLLEAARVIAGADLFVGNQTATHAIAEGLKKNIVLEVWREGPNVIVHRPGVVHGWNQNVELPDL
jgi:hypothetical protein